MRWVWPQCFMTRRLCTQSKLFKSSLLIYLSAPYCPTNYLVWQTFSPKCCQEICTSPSVNRVAEAVRQHARPPISKESDGGLQTRLLQGGGGSGQENVSVVGLFLFKMHFCDLVHCNYIEDVTPPALPALAKTGHSR